MARRTYNQACGIARALDLLGERWTLLIIRDLLVGPRRYSDLLEGLPGIGTNMLADRLKLLEAEGVVHRHPLPAPADSVTVYDLTDAGRELEPVFHYLVRWSWRHLEPPSPGQHLDTRWTVLALRASFDPEAAQGLDANYEVDLAGEKVWIRIQNGAIATGLGPASDPDVVLRSDERTLSLIRTGALSLEEAADQGDLQFEGTRSKITRMLEVLSRS